MPNSDLKDKFYKIPDKVISRISQMLSRLKINDEHAKGLKRAKDMVDNKKISYSQMKRIKNYFDTYEGDGNDDEYRLIGGLVTKEWINNALGQDRESIKTQKKAKMDGGLENQFLKTHEKDNDNTNLGKSNGGMIDIKSTGTLRGIMSGDAVYKENYNKEIGTIKYLIEYMNKK